MKNKLKISVALLIACALVLAALPLTALARSEGHALRDGEIWDGSIADSFAGGSGTESDPYLISNGSELAYLAQLVNSGSTPDWYDFFISLENDIYLNDISDWESWDEENAPENSWTPIGRAVFADDCESADQYDFSRAFKGAFNGNGHTVYGAYIVDLDGMEETGYGIFGCIGEGWIDLLNVDASYFCCIQNVGAIVGIHRGGVVFGCGNRGKVCGYYCTGGIVGDSYGNISDCVNYGCVEGVISTGGIVGRAYSSGAYKGSNQGRILGLEEVGGIAGTAIYSDFAYCANAGPVVGTSVVGGIVGQQEASIAAGCWNSADVTGVGSELAPNAEVAAVGGITGVMQSRILYDSEGIPTAYRSLTESCYNIGSIIGGDAAGGIVGVSGEEECAINCCYSAGFVGAEANADAILGFGGIFIGDAITNCYYLDSDESAPSPYAEAVTAEQLRNESTYEGFDFNEIWTMEGSEDYEYAELIQNPHFEAGGGEPVDPALPGDTDGNGSVTIADAILTLRIALQLLDADAFDADAADMNGDGSITIADAIMILRIAIGL